MEWRYDEEGERVRFSKRTGFTLPIPSSAEETADYKSKQSYVENKKKDTVSDFMGIGGFGENRLSQNSLITLLQ